MGSEDISRRIWSVIGASTNLVDMANLDELDDLYEAGLKSLAAVHLMLALEEEFGIEFPDAMLNRSAFCTIERIQSSVSALMTLSPATTGRY